MKAIETVYNGYRFRSRIEARWAVFFDAANIEYEYEPEGFDFGGKYYLTDFWLDDIGVFIEIKGDKQAHYDIGKQEQTADFIKAKSLAAHTGKSVFWLGGKIPTLSEITVNDMGAPIENYRYIHDIGDILIIDQVTWFRLSNNATTDKKDWKGCNICQVEQHDKSSWLFNQGALKTARMARFEHKSMQRFA